MGDLHVSHKCLVGQGMDWLWRHGITPVVYLDFFGFLMCGDPECFLCTLSSHGPGIPKG